MKTKDIPIVFLGVGILYIAYLFQNKMIRIPEGFQGEGKMPAEQDTQQAPAMQPASAMQPAPEVKPEMQPASAMQAPEMKPTTQPPSNQAQLQAMSAELKQISQNFQKIDAISQQLQSMSQMQPPAREGFQSYQNPYNMTSPSASQAYEFRLGKKSLTDEVLAVMSR